MNRGLAVRATRLATSSRLLSGLAEREAARLGPLVPRSGRLVNPSVVAAQSTTRAVIVGLAVFPLSLVGALLLSPFVAFVAVVPIVIFFLPELQLRDLASRRRESVDRELPFFSILVDVLGSAGVPLYAILQSILDADIFVAMKNEAMTVRRDVSIFGLDFNESLERLASTHPSRKFSGFLLGYTSKVRSGGDLSFYLTSESGSLLRELEQSWNRYATRVGVIGSLMITVFGVIPLMLMVVGIFSPGLSITGLVVFTGVGVPLFTVLLLYLAGRMQPGGVEPLRGKAARSLLLSLAGIVGWFVTGDIWVAAALGSLIFFVAYGTSVRGQLNEIREVEEALPKFTKDLMEFKRQDYDLTKALLDMSSNNGYNPSFDKVLAKYAGPLRAGVPIDEVKVECRSRLASLTFFLIGEMSRSGGGTVDTVYQLSNHADRLVEMKKNTRAEVKPYLVLSYVAPVLLAFGVTFVSGVLTTFSDTVRPAFSTLPLPQVQVGTIPGSLGQVSNLLIVVSAAALGLIGAKVTDLTMRNTLKASANVGIALAAMFVLSAVNIKSLL